MTYRLCCMCLVVLIGTFGCGKSDDLFDEASLSASTSSKASSSGVSEPSSSENASPKGKVSSGLAKIQALSDEICRCTDDACLDALEGGSKLVLKAFTQEMMDTYQSMDKVPKEIVEAVNSARDRAGACAKKLLGPLYRAKRGGKLSEVADKVCACKESACLKSLESVGKQAGDELKAALLAKYKTKEAVPKEILDGIGAALRRMKECETKLLNPQAPADAAQKTLSPLNVSLMSGGTLTLPAGTIEAKSLPRAKNGMVTTVYTNHTLGIGISLGQQIPTDKTCAQWVRDDDRQGEENMKREGKDLHMVLRPRVRKECDLQSPCIYREMGHRQPAEYKENKPYREAAGYSLCFGTSVVALTLVQLEAGKPMQDSSRKLLEKVVLSYRPPPAE